MCKLRAHVCARRCGRLEYIQELWHCQTLYNTGFCPNWDLQRMIKVASTEICDFCYEQWRQEQKIEMAVAEAMLRLEGEKKGWTKCRWMTERREFRTEFQEKIDGLYC